MARLVPAEGCHGETEEARPQMAFPKVPENSSPQALQAVAGLQAPHTQSLLCQHEVTEPVSCCASQLELLGEGGPTALWKSPSLLSSSSELRAPFSSDLQSKTFRGGEKGVNEMQPPTWRSCQNVIVCFPGGPLLLPSLKITARDNRPAELLSAKHHRVSKCF